MIKLSILIIQLFWLSYAFAAHDSLKFEKSEYGLSFESRSLVGYKLYKNGPFKNRRAVLLSEGIHGNEYLGLLDRLVSLNSLPEKFQKFITNGGVLLVIPQVNPDGVYRKNRYSSFGTDLNRDFRVNRLQMQETHLLSQWVESELKQFEAQLVLAIDYHCCVGALLYPDSQDSRSHELFKRYYSDITSMAQSSISSEITSGVTKDFFGRKTFGTLKDYWFKKYAAISFTFEAPVMDTSKLVFDQQVSWWEEILTYIGKLPAHEMLAIRSQQKADGQQGVEVKPVSYSE